MKIAILTLPLNENIGGILQAYALQKTLYDLGHSVVVLTPTNKISFSNKIIILLKYIKRFLIKNLYDKNQKIFLEKIQKKNNLIIQSNTIKFIKSQIKTQPINSFNDIRENEFDAIVVGSDQVWRPKYFKWLWKSNPENAFLNFAKKWSIKRIAYAASFGLDNTSEFSNKEIIRMCNLLKLFKSVSVREYSGVSICNNIFKINAIQVLDPTFLLDRGIYEKIVSCSGTNNYSGELLCYILDNNQYKTNLISNLSKELKLNPFFVSADTNNSALPLHERIQPSVEKWLRGFMDAKFVVTDSFHACVFSIIFNKPFIVIGNESRGLCRFTSLLSMFGLMNRLIKEGDQVPASLFIDWTSVNKILEKNKLKSLNFIKSSIQ